MTDKKISALPSATTPLAGTEVLPIVQSSTTKKVAVSDLTVGRDVVVNNLTTAANIGVGTSLSTWSSGRSAIQMYGSAMSYVTSSAPSGMCVSNNYYVNTSDKYLANGYAQQYVQYSDGKHYWLTAPNNSSGAGAAASFTTLMTLDTSGNLTANTGNLVIGTSGKGIDFSANTHAAGMTSEVLNWYEEGAFTPTVQGSTTAGVGTYNARTGVYTRIGNLVTVQVYINLASHTGTGNIQFGALPFTSATGAGIYGSATIGYLENCTVPATSQVLAFISPNTTFVGLYSIPSGGGAMIPVAMDTTFSVMYTAIYRVA